VNPTAGRALSKELQPGHAYTLSLGRGDANLAGLLGALGYVTRVFWYARGPNGARGGLLDRGHDEAITGASHLYLFFVDLDPGDNRGTLEVIVRDRTSGRREALRVDAARNCIALGPANALEVDLPRTGHWRVELSGRAELGPGGLPLLGWFNEVTGFVFGGVRIEDCYGLVPMDRSFEPRPQFFFARFFFIDDDPADDRGELRIRLSPR
jgi:hypothetical protein